MHEHSGETVTGGWNLGATGNCMPMLTKCLRVIYTYTRVQHCWAQASVLIIALFDPDFQYGPVTSTLYPPGSQRQVELPPHRPDAPVSASDF